MIRHLVIKRNAPVTGESPLLKKEEEETRRPREDRSSRDENPDTSESAAPEPVAESTDEISTGEES